MRAFGWAFTCLLILVGAASADGYQDFNTGVAEAQRFEPEAAIKFLSLALSEPGLPDHLRPVAYLARGREYGSQKHYGPAIADFTAAIGMKSGYIDAYVTRCAAYAEQSDLEQALADCRFAAQSDQKNWQLRALLMSVEVQARQFDSAISEYSEFIAARPDDAGLLLGRSNVYRYAGQYQKALVDAKDAHDLSDKWAAPYAELGLIYLAENDLEKARDSFDSEIERSKDDPVPYLQKGQVEWAMGHYDQASESFRESLKHSELQQYAFMWLAIAASKQGAQLPGNIVARFSNTDLSEWPGPLLSTYLGKSPAPDVQHLIGDDPDGDDDKQCAASFFIGEWHLIKGNTEEAKRLLQNTVAHCSVGSSSRAYAAIELGRLP